jgi:hypothetical protein
MRSIEAVQKVTYLSRRIEYLNFISDRYPNKKGLEIFFEQPPHRKHIYILAMLPYNARQNTSNARQDASNTIRGKMQAIR